MGSGVLFGVPVGGVTVANPTPWRYAILQDAQLDLKAKLVKLRGRKQHAVKERRAEIDISVKSKVASLDPNMINQLILGCPQAAGMTIINEDEAGVVGGGIPAARQNTHQYNVGDIYSLAGFIYKCVTAGISAGAPPALSVVIGSENEDGAAIMQCIAATGNTITVANAGTFVMDYGVKYSNGSAPLINSGLVAPVQGQYQVSSGIYTFSAADIAAGVKISYTSTVVRGTTITLNNQVEGSAPEFKALLYDIDELGKYFAIELNDCIVSDFSIPTKQGAFWVCDISFDAFADSSEVVGHIYADTF
jgi:hypothetical protein